MENNNIIELDSSSVLLQQLLTNDKVTELENIGLDQPQLVLDTTHLIHGKMYARTIFMPAGTLLTGVLSNLDNVCIVCGDITVTTQDGLKRFTGYHVLPAISGSKRAGITHADTYWTTLIHTNNTTVTDCENEFTNETEKLQTRRLENNTLPQGDIKCLTQD